MRTFLISFSLTILLAGANQATAAIPVAATVDTIYTPKTVHHKPLYEKGKGTIGFLCGFLLGPVGWLGVRVFSHNRTQRKKATEGMIALGVVIFFVGLLYLAGKSGNAGDFNFFSNPPNPPHRRHAAVNNGLAMQNFSASKPIVAPSPDPLSVLPYIH
jgi:hypothetical protein